MRPVLLALLLPLAGLAGDLDSERFWTGTSGKSFRGTFLHLSNEGRTAVILDTTGRYRNIDLEDFCDKDRRLIESSASREKKASEARGAAELFQPPPNLNRSHFPLLANGDGLTWQTGLYAVGTHLLWWDAAGWIEIPRRGDTLRKAIWLSKRLERDVTPKSTRAALPGNIMNGFADYFRARHKGAVTWRGHYCFDQTPETFRHYSQGPAACVVYTIAGDYGILWPLVGVTDKGVVRLACGDKVIEASWAATNEEETYSGHELDIPRPDGSRETLRNGFDRKKIKRSKLTILNPDDLPSWIAAEGTEFTLSPRNPMVVFRPYPLKTPAKDGKLPPPPVDPLFDDAPDVPKPD